MLRGIAPLLVIAVALGVWQRERLWIWYCAERLERASEDGRSEWGDKLAEAGEPAVPTLLRLLRSDDSNVCSIAKSSMEKMVSTWPQDDERRPVFAEQFVEAEPRFSTPGRFMTMATRTCRRCSPPPGRARGGGVVDEWGGAVSGTFPFEEGSALIRPPRPTSR